MKKKINRLSLFILDVLIVLLIGVVIFILLTGGKVFYFGTTLVRLQGVENPLTFLFILGIIRYLLSQKAPFLGLATIDKNTIAERCSTLCNRLFLGIANLETYKIYRIVLLIIGISLIIKIFNAYCFYGFFSGDDVEIHEMTFSYLFDWGTKAWNIRSPFYPMVFIFPVQAILFSLGINEPFYLIFSGRMVVVLFSALNLYLVFIIAARLFKSMPVGLFSMFFLALSKLHTTMGSSELPRTIASTCILVAFWLMLQEKNQRILVPVAGMVLAIGASIRFSEAIFLVPAFFYLFLHKRLRQAFSLVALFVVAFAFINYLSDKLYWGQPFFSLKNLVDFTILKKQSTRGFQPLLYYILSIGLWTNYFSFGLMLCSLRQNLKKIWIWVAAPILLLSLFPHKEPRYLLPVIPFYCIMVGLSVWGLLGRIYHNDFKIRIQKRISTPILVLMIPLIGIVIQAQKEPRFGYLVFLFSGLIIAVYFLQDKIKRNNGVPYQREKVNASNIAVMLVLALLGVIIFEVNGFFFRRSESGVEMARFLRMQKDNRGVAIEEIWRAGGRLYLWQKPLLLNIERSLIKERKHFVSSIKGNSIGWVGIRDNSLSRYGYASLLYDFGFKEVKFSEKIRLETYRLFKKENNDSNQEMDCSD